MSRSIVEQGIYPAIDPLASSSRILEPNVVGNEHYKIAQAVRQILQQYQDLQDIVAILGMDELADEDKLIVNRARSTTLCHNLSMLQKNTQTWSFCFHRRNLTRI